MTPITITSVIGIALVALSISIYFFRKALIDQKLKKAEENLQEKIKQGNKEFDKIVSKGYEENKQYKSKLIKQAEDEIKARYRTVTEIEKRINDKENQLLKKENTLSNKSNQLDNEIKNIQKLQNKQHIIIKELSNKLENIVEMSKDEAEKLLISNTEKELKNKLGKLIKDKEQEAKKIANRKAIEIITHAIQRTAVDHVAAITTTTLELPEDEMKGRVIGKEGRNIRAFESISGVDVIIDDTPGAVVLSAFDPIRRELARLTMKKLLEDGRIHPTKIEEEYEKAKKFAQQNNYRIWGKSCRRNRIRISS